MRQISLAFEEIKDNYFVTEDGNIFNMKFNRKLNPFLDKYGYRAIRLTGKDGKVYNRFVHRLVLASFDPIENFQTLTVNHKDGNKENNNINNLEWNSIEENNNHALENRLNGKTGSKNPNSKFNKKQIKEILEMCEYKKIQDVADHFNASYTTILNIKNGKRYKKEFQEIKNEIG